MQHKKWEICFECFVLLNGVAYLAFFSLSVWPNVALFVISTENQNSDITYQISLENFTKILAKRNVFLTLSRKTNRERFPQFDFTRSM